MKNALGSSACQGRRPVANQSVQREAFEPRDAPVREVRRDGRPQNALALLPPFFHEDGVGQHRLAVTLKEIFQLVVRVRTVRRDARQHILHRVPGFVMAARPITVVQSAFGLVGDGADVLVAQAFEAQPVRVLRVPCAILRPGHAIQIQPLAGRVLEGHPEAIEPGIQKKRIALDADAAEVRVVM